MRYWMLPVALCAFLSPSPTARVNGGAPPRSLFSSLPALAAAAPELTASAAASSGAASTPQVPMAEAAAQRAAQILARPELAAYHGWVRYLELRAARASERYGDKPGAVVEDRLRFAQWTQKILDNPGLLAELRGVVEWAYLSPVDGSGQPFRLNIPTDYDVAQPAPLTVHLHGRTGNHLEDSSAMRPRTGELELAVLGRARGGQYRGLSEADVLAALDYVSEHWAVDRRRVHLHGGGMGGSGALWLASRHPQRFASSRSVCGSASDKPVGNLLTVPIYALHSVDDERVPVQHARGPLNKLLELGGKVTLDEPNGYGHQVWHDQEGNARAQAWYAQHASPLPNELRRIDFTALDGSAASAYWAAVAEWGPEPRPARFVLHAPGKNRLEARLDNIRSLHLRLADAPLDLNQPLRVSIEGAPPLTVPAPLPAELWLERGTAGWEASELGPVAPFRLHTPGGANQLYAGEPLLIVYGTQGDEATRAALRSAAELASRSSSASWSRPNKEGGDDGVPYNQNLYGELAIKADRDVSAEDLAQRHLVLIGSATQNSVVASLAARLPAKYESGTISWSDGTRTSARDRALGLVHYNPAAPGRLLFWVAADDPAAYAAGALAPELLGVPTGADAVVVRVSEPALVTSRSFNSRWQWLPRAQTALLPAELTKGTELGRAMASALRRAAPADFAVAGLVEPARTAAFEAGEARVADLLTQHYFSQAGVLTVLGSELAKAAQALTPAAASFEPALVPQQLEPQRKYKVALSTRQLTSFLRLTRLTRLTPLDYQVLNEDVASALFRFGLNGLGARGTVSAASTERPAVAQR